MAYVWNTVGVASFRLASEPPFLRLGPGELQVPISQVTDPRDLCEIVPRQCKTDAERPENGRPKSRIAQIQNNRDRPESHARTKATWFFEH